MWLIVIPLDKDASCFHGKNSDWCTTKVNRPEFEQYFYDKQVTLIYCLNKQTAGMWAIATHTKTDQIEIFDQQDNTITAKQFQTQTGLAANSIVGLAREKTNASPVTTARDSYNQVMIRIEQIISEPAPPADITELVKLLRYTKSGTYSAAFLEKYRGTVQLPEDLLLLAVKMNDTAIQYIKNPSPEVQLAAVTQNGIAIQYIKNPTPEVQLATVTQNGIAIQYIKNPTPEVQLAAVTQNGWAIQFIKEPTPELQLAAVTQDGWVIEYINNPTPEVQLAAKKWRDPQ
jgi:hypothetical protein